MSPTPRTPSTSQGLALAITLAVLPLSACESLPGSRTQQATTAGAVAGAAAGAMIAGENNRLVGALLGAAIGAGGGYLIGAHTGWFGSDEGHDRALDAIASARQDPATVSDVERATTADLNADGFVTFDEIVAMEEAGLADEQMISRLQATGQVFELNTAQRNALLAEGVSPRVLDEMQEIRRDEKQRMLSAR